MGKGKNIIKMKKKTSESYNISEEKKILEKKGDGKTVKKDGKKDGKKESKKVSKRA